ncbi:alternative NAD(P)H dehydrogenase 1 [Striga asiatica]|uniref:Alternative NAD(P)H dehydrogenase 1 n=1 Tax=Striga asiatica TaxID=4170 RepID=A0A5A7PVB4_STRAF|nr:alternative NAD(P)H dehydrogenase 1 [Striga asiatica]
MGVQKTIVTRYLTQFIRWFDGAPFIQFFQNFRPPTAVELTADVVPHVNFVQHDPRNHPFQAQLLRHLRIGRLEFRQRGEFVDRVSYLHRARDDLDQQRSNRDSRHYVQQISIGPKARFQLGFEPLGRRLCFYNMNIGCQRTSHLLDPDCKFPQGITALGAHFHAREFVKILTSPSRTNEYANEDSGQATYKDCGKPPVGHVKNLVLSIARYRY